MQQPTRHSSGLDYLLLIVAIAMTIGISYYSLKPPSLEKGYFPSIDKIQHFFSYFFLCIVYFFTLRNYFKLKSPYKKAVIFAIALGTLLEFLQLIPIFNRYFDIIDLVANILGAIIAILIIKSMIPEAAE